MSEEIKPDRWSQLSDEERALILRRLSKRSESENVRAIPRRLDQETAPLSFSQEQLWFLDQFEPGVTAYIRPWVLRFRGPLSVQALEKSLAEIINRHEALRTIIISSEGQPHQRILPVSPYELPITDLRDKENRDAIAMEIAKKDANTPFDLLKDSLLRTQLIRLTSEDHLLLLTTHHIAFDGWSERIMFKELSELYTKFSSDEVPDLPPPSLQFPDFALWQRNFLRDGEFDRLAAFWQNELAGVPPLLRLRTDYDRPRTRSYLGDSASTILSQGLSTAIKSMCQDEGITLFMALLAAYKVVLMINSDEDDIIVGGTLSGRNDLQLQGVIGFFVNTLVLRTDLSGDPSLMELIERVRTTVLKALDYQDLPFEKLVEILNPRRDLSYTPVVQATLQLRNLPDRGPGFPDLDVEEIDLGVQEALFDLSLRVEELPEGLNCKLLYNEKLFSRESAERILAQFQLVLSNVVADPGINLSNLRLLEGIRSVPPDGRYAASTHLREFSSPILDGEIQEKSNLTGTQLLVWAGQKFRPESLLYNLPYTFTIHGPVDKKIFEQSFQVLVDNTDSLRTVISEENGIPQQHVLAEVPARVKIHDFTDSSDPETAARVWIDTNSTRIFNLSERPFDAALLRVASEKWIWFLHVHHVISDNVGIQLIFERMEEIYRDLSEGIEPEKRVYPQYRDYVLSEKEKLRSKAHFEAHEFWSQKLATPSEPLSFFGDRSRKDTTQVRRITLDLNKTSSDELKALAKSEPFFTRNLNVSLTNIFAGLLFTLLYRITANRDLSIAMPFHNRRTPEAKSTIGLLMEVLPLRISVDEDETFTSLMEKVTSEASEILQHRNFTVGNPIHHPVYETVLNFQTAAVKSFDGSPVDMSRIHNGHEEDSISLLVHDYGASGAFCIDFDFHFDVFSKEEHERAISYFQRVLNSVVENPDQPLDKIDILSERERERLLYEFNSTDTTYSIETTVINFFEKQVEESPEKTAVIQEDRSLTYHELNAKANQVAQRILAIGLGSDDPVGIYLERSPEMIVAMMGILKAGCAYLPLDPKLPKDRLNFILRDSEVKVVLTESSIRDNLPGRRIVKMNLDVWSEFEVEDEKNPPLLASPEDLAYIVYTSGSTGNPKGVMIEHHSLVNFIEWAGESWEIGPHDRFLQFISLSWDAHIEEIFPTLSRGGTLVLRTEAMIESIQSYFEAIDKENITVLAFPTPYWHEVVNAMEQHGLRLPSSVRLVEFGGDRASPKRVAAWQKHVDSSVRLLNCYGVTESTSIATQVDISEKSSGLFTTVPIGKPINNTRVYVLDKYQNPLPTGLPGELWIGGEGLSRGYVNNPELTAKHFHLNPFTTSSNDRYYRSGDIARFLPDGNLEMLGRMDNQVKIRGYRVELNEIELVLSKHKAIEEVVVLASEMGDDRDPLAHREKRLVAYFQRKASSKVKDVSNELRSYLREKLPDYMIPTYFIELETFPQTILGKIDHDALPLPDVTETKRPHEYVPPRNSMERQLVAIWEQVLGVHPIGVDDNFFDLGGHSLMAVRLFSQIESKFGIKLPLMTLFSAPTIANQAKSLMSKGEEADPTWVVEVQTGGSKPPFFCISPSVIDVITYRELSRNLGDDQPFYALYSEQMGLWREGKHQLEAITSQLIDRIQKITSTGPFYIGGYSAGGIVSLQVARELERQGHQVSLLVLFDTFGPNYPRLRQGITPGIFNALRIVRRIQSYWWKFLLLDWKGRLQYLRLPRIHRWVRDRYGEVRTPVQPPPEDSAYFLTPARREFNPETYDGKVLLIRAEKGLMGIHKDPKMGWDDVFINEFEVCMVPGDHEAMLFGPRSKFVADQLNEYLASANNSP